MWNELSLSDKARMMALAVKSGITDLSTIQSAYNKFAEGGEKPTLKEKAISKLKDMAYKIATEESIYRSGNAHPVEIVHALLRKRREDEPEDDNKKAYIYGTGERFPEITEPIKGFDYTNYLNKSGYKNVKNVYGTINPEQYSIEPEYKDLVEELAKHRYHFYANADEMFLDSDPDVIGYRDDVGNFIHQLDLDDKGNVLIHDSDVYDFNPVDYKYTRGSGKLLTKLEAKMMDKIGTPYIIRQENQPLYFEGNWGGAGSTIAEHLNNLSEEKIAKITGSGLLEPARILYDHREDYDPDKNFSYAEGGQIHIKPENRGKFTALKERTGHSASWFKEHGTPAQKKMATFALNARKWHH